MERQVYVKDKSGAFVEPEAPSYLHVWSELRVEGDFLRNSPKLPRLSRDQFLRLAGQKRSLYERAFATLDLHPITQKDAHVAHFVKCENTNLSMKPDAVPRAICPQDPRYICELGRYIKAIEKNCYRRLDKMWGGPVVMKGRNAVSRAAILREKWLKFGDPVAIGADASRFDQHVSRPMLEWEHTIYKSYFPGDNGLAKLLRWQLVNHITGRFPEGTVSVVVDGHRMSGAPNTALGNTIIMSAMCHAYVRYKRVPCEFVNDGDDSVFIMERCHARRFVQGAYDWFIKLGFRMEFEAPVDIFEQIEFCQAQPLWNGREWIMCRNHYLARAKDLTSFKIMREKEFWRWIRAVGDGGLALSAGVPVFQAFYECLRRSSQHVDPSKLDQWSGLAYLSKGLKPMHRAITPEARASYCRAFAVNPMVQHELERYYEHCVITWVPGEFPSLSGFSSPHDPALRLFDGERLRWSR